MYRVEDVTVYNIRTRTLLFLSILLLPAYPSTIGFGEGMEMPDKVRLEVDSPWCIGSAKGAMDVTCFVI